MKQILRRFRDRIYLMQSEKSQANSDRESAYFYTFHKCASSLFSAYVLRNINDLRHIDYERQSYSGSTGSQSDLASAFSDTGCIYGPIRLSAGKNAPAAKLLSHTMTEEFVRDKIALFLIRDPRDILVSRYFSFGFSHSESQVPEIRERQRRQRERIQGLGVDGYALEFSPRVRVDFEHAARLSQACERHVVLKFEDMIENFDGFREDFTRYIDVSGRVLDEMYKRTRPPEKEDVSSHKRSGRAGGYKAKLKAETVAAIDAELAPMLDHFGYTRT